MSRGVWVVGAFGLVGGCANTNPAAPVAEVDAPVPATAAAAADLTEPPVIAADAGLEATWVVSAADETAFAGAMTPYLDNPVPASAEALGLWAANGLRVVGVPLSEWPGVSAALRVSGAAQRQWMTVSGQWAEIVRGPERPRGQVVALDAERVELGPGRLRMLSRCWVAPVPAEHGARAEFIAEFLPQLHEQRGGSGLTPTQAPRVQDPVEQGLVFERMRLSLRARSDPGGPYAYLVVSERPGVDWRRAVGERPESDEPAETEADERPAAGVGEVVRNGAGRGKAGSGAAAGSADAGSWAGPTGAGPQPPLLATLGEALFAAPLPSTRPQPDRAETPRTARSVLVLIPRVPESYRMLPPPPAAAPQRPR